MTRDGSIEFLSDPKRWPCYPYCPLKKYKGPREFPDFADVRVSRGFLEFRLKDDKSELTPGWVPTTVQEIIEGGWVVD